MVAASSGLSQGDFGPLALMQWRHSRLHHVPVICTQSVESPTKGATGARLEGVPTGVIRDGQQGRSAGSCWSARSSSR